MALENILDYAAIRIAANITGIKAAYSTASSDEGAEGFPRSIDNGPVCFVMPGSGEAEAGNFETEVHEFEAEVWVPASEIATAYREVIPFAARFREEFRTDTDNNATAVRVLYQGYGQPYYDDTAGKPFLVMPIRLEALEIYASNDYAS